MVQPQAGLPGHCFISAEAVMWVQSNVPGAHSLASAMKIMKAMLEEGLVLHASGNPKHKFIFGFYLYYFSYSKIKSGKCVVRASCAALFDLSVSLSFSSVVQTVRPDSSMKAGFSCRFV
jgi:hypothetical protein